MQSVDGERFGRLTVVSEAPRRIYPTQTARVMLCKCDCGNVKEVKLAALRSGAARSCGCIRKETALQNVQAARESPWKEHGLSDTPEHHIWRAIKQRCTNPRNKAFQNYGGRGIQMCQAWMESFEAFLADMGTRPAPGLTVERKNNNGHYEPNNCEWATYAKQTANRRCSIWIDVDGERLSATEFAVRTGTPYTTMYRWIKTLPVEEFIRRVSVHRRSP